MENKKKMPLPLLILVISIILGLVIAGVGFLKQNMANKTNEERAEEAYKLSEQKVAVAEKRLEEIQIELKDAKQKYDDKKQECDSLDMRADNWFADKSKCERDASNIYSQISALESEQWSIKNADYTVYYDLVEPMSYQIFYIIGGGVALLGVLGAFIIYLVKGKKTY